MTKDEFFNYGKYGGTMTMSERAMTMTKDENDDDE